MDEKKQEPRARVELQDLDSALQEPKGGGVTGTLWMSGREAQPGAVLGRGGGIGKLLGNF